MDGTDFIFPTMSRVRLRDGVDPGFYDGMAKVGNEGWIDGHRRDRFGLPEVHIRWDPNHWAYNRQPDRWTYQEHFDLVEEIPVSQDSTDPISDLVARFASELTAAIKGDQKQPEAPPAAEIVETSKAPESEKLSRAERFAGRIQDVVQALVDSEAFMVIYVNREPDERAPQGALMVDVVGDALTSEAELLLGSQISRIGAQMHHSTAVLQIHHLAAQKEADGGSTELSS